MSYDDALALAARIQAEDLDEGRGPSCVACFVLPLALLAWVGVAYMAVALLTFLVA